MSNTPEISEAKRILLEKYLRGDLQLTTTTANAVNQGVEAEIGDPRARVVEVQIRGSKRPFFFLHGSWINTPSFCFSLARELGSDQPFYALEPYPFDGLPMLPTIETMAAAHIKSIRTVQPEGPYLLGGWCNGGLVAYEMARQLHAAGQTIDLLVLMDAFYLGYHTRRRMLRAVVSHLGNLIGLGPDKQLDWFLRLLYVSKLLYYPFYLYGHRRQGRIALPRFNSLIPAVETLTPDYPSKFEWIDMAYKPPSLYPGKITFFWPSEDTWYIASWRKLIEAKEAQEIEVHILPGNQENWKTEHFHTLAQHLKMCLNKAQ